MKKPMKKAVIVAITAMISIGTTLAVNAADEIRIRVDGQFIDTGDTAPQMHNDRTLVPLGAVMTQLGFAVDWDPAHRTVFLTMYGMPDILLPIDDRPAVSGFSSFNGIHRAGEMYLSDNRVFTLDAAPTIINDRTMVPVRAIAQAAQMEVDWDPVNRIVEIITSTTSEVPPTQRVAIENRRQTEAERSAWVAHYWAAGGISDFEREIVAVINQVRASYGLSHLTIDYGLAMASRFYAQTLAELNLTLGHNEGPYGGSAGTVESFGFNWNAVNALAGRWTAQDTVDAWMASSSHRQNILTPALRYVGMGSHEGGQWGIISYSIMSNTSSGFTAP
ncbi:MAG: stalk domain-containing protein [Defluviitaleaceae bacterium]|nr:stalk domain-containing protein [Defluviitaleaceae bacterium]